MSNSKSKRRSKNRKSASSKKPQSSPNNATDAKRQVSGMTAVLIALPILGLFGWIAWSVLGAGNSDPPDLNGAGSSQSTSLGNDSATINTTKKNESSRTKPDWATTSDNDVWTTVEDQVESWKKIDNAAEDGWRTEVISDRITELFLKLKKVIVSKDPLEPASVEFLATDQLSISSLLPDKVETVFEDERFKVQRGVFNDSNNDSLQGDSGAKSLADALLEITSKYKQRDQLHMKLKVFRIDSSDDEITTQQTLELSGETESGNREENAVWQAEWTNERKPRLKSLKVVQYENVDLAGGLMFADCTESVLGGNKSFLQQLLIGYDRWLDRVQSNNAFVLLGNNGIAVGDVNGDGLEDIYVTQEAGLPNLLYLQNKDGSLRDASKESGANWLQNSSAALIVDVNNDGHQDLIVGVTGGVVVAEGDSTGKFRKRMILDSNDNIWSLTAADYDRDGLLDLYVGTYSADGAAAVAANVVISSDDGEYVDGGQNSLYRNVSEKGSFEFQDVTKVSGLLENNFRYTFAAAWEDYDNDGDQDLYVANDFGWNNFYRNDLNEDGTIEFVDIAVSANAQDDAFGMSVNWADYDRDGWMDVYISNMFSYAGNRITFQDQFKSDSSDNLKKRYQRYARGNTLLRNLGASGVENNVQMFEDQSLQTAVNMGRWSWSSCFVDFNNDGWEDLFVTNGYITSDDNGDL